MNLSYLYAMSGSATQTEVGLEEAKVWIEINYLINLILRYDNDLQK